MIYGVLVVVLLMSGERIRLHRDRKDFLKYLEPLTKIACIRSSYMGTSWSNKISVEVKKPILLSESGYISLATCKSINDTAYTGFSREERKYFKDTPCASILKYWKNVRDGGYKINDTEGIRDEIDSILYFKELETFGEYGDLRSAYIRLLKLTIAHLDAFLSLTETCSDKEFIEGLGTLQNNYEKSLDILLDELKSRKYSCEKATSEYSSSASKELLQRLDKDYRGFQDSIKEYTRICRYSK